MLAFGSASAGALEAVPVVGNAQFGSAAFLQSLSCLGSPPSSFMHMHLDMSLSLRRSSQAGMLLPFLSCKLGLLLLCFDAGVDFTAFLQRLTHAGAISVVCSLGTFGLPVSARSPSQSGSAYSALGCHAASLSAAGFHSPDTSLTTKGFACLSCSLAAAGLHLSPSLVSRGFSCVDVLPPTLNFARLGLPSLCLASAHSGSTALLQSTSRPGSPTPALRGVIPVSLPPLHCVTWLASPVSTSSIGHLGMPLALQARAQVGAPLLAVGMLRPGLVFLLLACGASWLDAPMLMHNFCCPEPALPLGTLGQIGFSATLQALSQPEMFPPAPAGARTGLLLLVVPLVGTPSTPHTFQRIGSSLVSKAAGRLERFPSLVCLGALGVLLLLKSIVRAGATLLACNACSSCLSSLLAVDFQRVVVSLPVRALSCLDSALSFVAACHLGLSLLSRGMATGSLLPLLGISCVASSNVFDRTSVSSFVRPGALPPLQSLGQPGLQPVAATTSRTGTLPSAQSLAKGSLLLPFGELCLGSSMLATVGMLLGSITLLQETARSGLAPLVLHASLDSSLSLQRPSMADLSASSRGMIGLGSLLLASDSFDLDFALLAQNSGWMGAFVSTVSFVVLDFVLFVRAIGTPGNEEVTISGHCMQAIPVVRHAALELPVPLHNFIRVDLTLLANGFAGSELALLTQSCA
ncbi:unnamed protein product [Effrenium voratum]|nr:unnamed protein product [Effrenium voratum]